MRKVSAEWLLVPLFLLPVLLAGGFCYVARERLLTDLAPFRNRPEEVIRDRVAESVLPRLLTFEDLPEGVSATLPGGDVRVLGTPAPRGAVWTFSGARPAGLTAAAVGDGGVRLRIEGGASPITAGEVDEGTREFARLASGPDLDALRSAPLPAATKLFLVRRWLAGGASDPGLAAAEGTLAVLAGFVREAASRGWPETPGEHRYGPVRALVPSLPGPVMLYPEGWRGFSHLHGLLDMRDDPARISVTYPGDDDVPAGALFCGWLEEPVAGRFIVTSRWGSAFWRTPFFSRWAGPVTAALILYLVLPTALWLAVRRRRKLDEARRRFLTEIAHDLRTPITSLRLYSEMLAEGRAPEDGRERYVEVLARESTRVSALLGNLLDLSRLERGARELTIERIDLEEAAEPAVREFVLQHPGRGDDVRVTGEDGSVVLADRSALHRILGNLLGNAGKFTSPGTPVRLSWSETGGGEVVIRLFDEGPGIPPAERRGLFRRYVRGERAKRDGVPGTGLGLSLVRDLAESMGGSASHVPSEGGAIFEVRLPGGRDG